MSEDEMKVWCAVFGVIILGIWFGEVCAVRRERRWDDSRRRNKRGDSK